jgi:hypothetical protein
LIEERKEAPLHDTLHEQHKSAIVKFKINSCLPGASEGAFGGVGRVGAGVLVLVLEISSFVFRGLSHFLVISLQCTARRTNGWLAL